MSVVNVAPASAWWPQGHSTLSEAAVRTLPDEVPAFFRQGAAQIAHCTQDPDVAKNPKLGAVTDGEAPEHYIDWEMLRGAPLPPKRYEFLQLCARLGIDAKDAGLLPYAVEEGTQRLAIALAEHRRWPDNIFIQTKCLVYAGHLAHYAQDLCMPLHTTIHHDGRVPEGGRSPRSGIHSRVDSLIEKLEMKPDALAEGLKIGTVADLGAAVRDEMMSSRALIDRTYELESALPPSKNGEDWKPSPELRSFAEERARASVRFTATLYATAWQMSASVKLPVWLQREPAPLETLK